MSIFAAHKNPGAYQGELTCPFIIRGFVDGVYYEKPCVSRAIRYVEHVTPLRLRYRCRKCGGTFQYDISGRNDANPYAPYKKGKIWSKIEKTFHELEQKFGGTIDALDMGGSTKGGVQ
jgi:hypothetical protein